MKRLLFPNSENGFITPALISFIIVLGIITVAVFEVMYTNIFIVGNNIQSQKAFNIAEAGINYYLWHLSHNQTDYKDGQTTPTTPDPVLGYGPYVHNYIDANAVNEGTYTLWIKPQGGGSTIATVEAIGKVTNSTVRRTVQAQIGAPSFASYAVVSDSALWFGNNESADGPVHSNQGIRMDGSSDNDVTSANSTYTPDFSVGGDGLSHPGVWCSSSVTSPVNCNTRVKDSWLYPVPSIDFNQVTSALCTMKKTAFLDYPSTSALASQANACSLTPVTKTAAYLPQRSASYSLTKGYLIELNNNGTYNLSYVNGENDTKSSYSSALTLQSIASNIALPPSGVIFTEDNVWVRSNPTFHGRVTIAAGKLASASNTAEIVIASPLLYSTKNGADAIGLVSQDSVTIAPYAIPTTATFNFEIDGAMLAEAGNVEFPVTYRSASNKCTTGYVNPAQTFQFYGSAAMRQIWTWNWEVGGPCGNAAFDPTNGWISGVEHTTTSYDYNLQYNPPPSYPITSTYNVLSWREVLTKP
jgi:Tfp pilus assembly protein PilX